MVWTLVAALVISLIVSIVMAPSAPEQKPQELDAGRLPTADEGKPIPVVFGTVMVEAPNVVWYGDIGYEAVRTGSGK